MNHYVFLELQPWKHLVFLNRVPGRTRGPDLLPSQLPALFPWLPSFFPLALLEDLSSTTLPKLPFSAPSRPHDSVHGPTCQGRKTKITRTVLTFAELSCEAAITLDFVLVQYIRFYELSLLANEEPISILQNKNKEYTLTHMLTAWQRVDDSKVWKVHCWHCRIHWDEAVSSKSAKLNKKKYKILSHLGPPNYPIVLDILYHMKQFWRKRRKIFFLFVSLWRHSIGSKSSK